jgi:sarcosine oxidase subunit beta
MSEHADIVVIGGGVIGGSTAFHLAKAGDRRVLLLERAFIGAGATGKSHSIIRVHYTNPHDASLAIASLPYFRNWHDLVGHGDCGFRETGVLRLTSAREVAKLRANVEMLQGIGAETRIVDRAEIGEIDPGLFVDDIECAAWERGSGYADPLATANGFVAAARSLGAELRTGVEVTAIRRDGDRAAGVDTSHGFIATDRVVVASGAWSAGLLAPLGFAVPLVSKRVQIVVFRRPDNERARPQSIVFDGSLGIVVRPEGEADTWVAMGFEKDPVDPDSFDEGVDAGYIDACRTRLSRRRPQMAAAPSRGGWSGATAETPDGHIVIDQMPVRGVFAAVGCSGTNFKTAPAVGRALAELATEGSSRSVDVRAFRASRFAEREPIVGRYEYGEGAADVWR